MAMEKEGGQDMTGLQAHPNVAKNAEHYRPCDSLKRESWKETQAHSYKAWQLLLIRANPPILRLPIGTFLCALSPEKKSINWEKASAACSLYCQQCHNVTMLIEIWRDGK